MPESGEESASTVEMGSRILTLDISGMASVDEDSTYLVQAAGAHVL